MTRSLALLALVVALATPRAVAGQAAQSQPRLPVKLPKQFQPPPGMCRLWIEGVPSGKQPAPTDCVRALRDRPANGRVIFGDPVPGMLKERGKRGDRGSGSN